MLGLAVLEKVEKVDFPLFLVVRYSKFTYKRKDMKSALTFI